MKHAKSASLLEFDYPPPNFQSWIQAPLPGFLRTLPILLTVERQGSGRQGPSPLASPEEPAND